MKIHRVGEGSNLNDGKARVNSSNTHYSQPMSKGQILSFISHLRDEIISIHSQKTQPDIQKTILYLQDLTDIMSVPQSTGRQIIIGIMHLISILRDKHNISVILVAGSSPALTELANVEKDYYFHLSLLEGVQNQTFATMASDQQFESFNMLSDGTVFKTNVDRLPDFEKIEVLPPSPYFKSLQRAKSSPKECTDVYLSYLDQMALDLKTRVRRINWQNAKRLIERKGAVITGMDSVNAPKIMLESLGLPEDHLILLESLESQIWSRSKIDRLVLFALDAGHAITPSIFIDALAKIYETDVTRLRNVDLDDSFRVVPAVDGDSPDASGGSEVSNPVPLKEAAPSETIENALSHEESLNRILKKKEKLNPYEKKLLSTVINPSNSHLIKKI